MTSFLFFQKESFPFKKPPIAVDNGGAKHIHHGVLCSCCPNSYHVFTQVSLSGCSTWNVMDLHARVGCRCF
jgi:hypothetical protein